METMENNTPNQLSHSTRLTRGTQLLVIFIFVISVLLRIALATVNREAHDNHMEVMHLMLAENRLVERADCWECFQPKLYYSLVVLIIRAADLYPGYITPGMIITAQMVNAILGIAILAAAWAFLKSIPIQNHQIKIIAFALIAFNPKMIGINGEALNDTLAILLAMLAMLTARAFLQNGKPVNLIACIAFLSLGLATKTNLLVLALAVAFSFVIKAYISKERVALVATAALVAGIFVIAAINPLTQYSVNYQKYGEIVTMNRGIKRHVFPNFFEKTYIERPGIISVADGFFTFKYFSLLEYPRMTNGLKDYPAHRTSFWTYLYAYAHSVHFDNCPPTWSSTGDEYFTLTRSIFIFALPPSLMILIGAALSLTGFLNALFKRSPSLLQAADYGLFEITFWGYIAFLILYSMMYRDYSVMKTIYIYPAVLPFLAYFIRAGEILTSRKWFAIFLTSITLILVILYTAEITSLIVHLYSTPGYSLTGICQ
jgi:hypothetical protein